MRARRKNYRQNRKRTTAGYENVVTEDAIRNSKIGCARHRCEPQKESACVDIVLVIVTAGENGDRFSRLVPAKRRRYRAIRYVLYGTVHRAYIFCSVLTVGSVAGVTHCRVSPDAVGMRCRARDMVHLSHF